MNRIFRSDDGAEISEEDVAAVIIANTATAYWKQAVRRLTDALAPKTCGAVIAWPNNGWPVVSQGPGSPPAFPCILPAGHHPYGPDLLGVCQTCGSDPVERNDPIHSPGHMTAPETWSES